MKILAEVKKEIKADPLGTNKVKYQFNIIIYQLRKNMYGIKRVITENNPLGYEVFRKEVLTIYIDNFLKIPGAIDIALLDHINISEFEGSLRSIKVILKEQLDKFNSNE
jgi:hypothetical protein